MSGKRRECAEDLLPENHPRQLVGQGQWAKREALICVCDKTRIKAHRSADEERRRSGVVQASAAPGGKRRARRRGTAARVEGNHECSLKDPSTNTICLPPKHLIAAALERLRRDFVHPKSNALRDAALIFTGRVRVGCANGANNDELKPWVPHVGVS